MNRILHTVLVFTFAVCLSSAYVNKSLWASSCCGSKDGGHSSHESGENVVQTKAEVKSEKAEAVKDPVWYGSQRYQKGTFRRVQREGLLLLLGTLQKDL